MFYPVESLKKGGRFYICWVADSWPLRFATITHRQLYSQDIRVICNNLLEVMNDESGRTSRRFSLRLSSQLMRGLVRLYQRKMEIFISDACMFNATVMKMCNKIYAQPTSRSGVKRPLTGELPRIQIEEIEDVYNIETQLRNSKVVARVDDITLREPTMPEQRRVDDGFGELHPDQALLAIDRSMELMLARPSTSAHLSGLELPPDSERSHERSRLAPHDAPRMERLSEHDISLFTKSAEAPTLFDFGKEIPEISEIPPPDLTVPEPEKQVAEKGTGAPENGQNKDQPTMEIVINGVQDIVLEELEDEPQPKRKLKNKLIIDKRIKLSSDYLRARIGNNNLELRCENIKEQKVINIITPSYVLLSRAAHCGSTPYNRFGSTLGNMFRQAQSYLEDRKTPARDIEYPSLPRTRQQTRVTNAEQTKESRDKTIPEQEVQERSVDVSRNLDRSGQCLEGDRSAVLPPDVLDISELPTQIITMASPQKRASEFEEPAKKRRQDKVCLRRSAPITAREINVEKTPIEDIPTSQTVTERLISLLQTEDLADCSATRPGIEPTAVPDRQRKISSDTSETPLGSLDRTRVSLGESENSTESKIFLRNEWGTEATMLKIFRCIKEGSGPVTVHSLFRKWPLAAGRPRVAAAVCFTSILKLRQHGFIKVITENDSKEIKDIELGRLLLNPSIMHI